MEKDSYIKCIILKNNLKIDTIEDARIITFKSSNDTLVVMKDYWPIVGEFLGNIIFETADNSITLENVECFYCLSNNVLRIVYKENNDVG